jgi:hypothetical protein
MEHFNMRDFVIEWMEEIMRTDEESLALKLNDRIVPLQKLTIDESLDFLEIDR